MKLWYIIISLEDGMTYVVNKETVVNILKKIYIFANQISYIYIKNTTNGHSIGQRCFIKPIKNIDNLTLDIEQKHIGILKIGNSSLEALGINEGDLVGFKANREWEFIVDEQRLYCMKSNDIIIKYEYEGNEVEYNPSWACSS